MTPAQKARKSTLVHTFLLVPQQRRQQIRNHGTRTRLDFDGNCHSRREVGDRVIDLDLRPVERNPRGENEFLPFGFAAAFAFRAIRPVVVRGLRILPNYGVRRYAFSITRGHAVARIGCSLKWRRP